MCDVLENVKIRQITTATCFAWILFVANRYVININKFGVAVSRETVVQLANDDRSNIPIKRPLHIHVKHINACLQQAYSFTKDLSVFVIVSYIVSYMSLCHMSFSKIVRPISVTSDNKYVKNRQRRCCAL